MLDDKYRIERLLATGGMGAVYLGTHVGLRKRVAIKVLSPHLTTEAMIARFHREAITASQIGHEGIAQVTDLGTSAEGEPFLVMEYLEGESLASRLKAKGPLAIEDACEIGCAILSPLAAAHGAGIVHRDLKPDNVFLVRQSRGETVKLLDFGISRATHLESDFRLTATGLVLGTPYYMSPEQARGESDVTPASDLYAFGVILYEMLIGDVPIRAENYNALMFRVTTGEFRRPRERRADLPEDLERIILGAMAQAPEDRPASALELEQALLPFCRQVFRDHASGRISAPALWLATSPGSGMRKAEPGPGASPAASDYALFAGATEPGLAGHPPGHPAIGALGAGASASAARAAEAHDTTPVPRVTPTGVVAPGATTAAPRPRRARIALGIAIVAAAAAGAAAAVRTIAGHGAQRVAAATPPPPPAHAPAGDLSPPPTASAPRVTSGAGAAPVAPSGGSATGSATAPPPRITLGLAIDPPGAVIVLDGERVIGAELVVDKDDALHHLQVSAPGYLSYAATVPFDGDKHLAIQLQHAGPPIRGKAPHRSSPKNEKADPSAPLERIDPESPYSQGRTK